ncbi:DUF1702 family protein [Microbispora cellulosiformans]|uniref:DUF1702 family protein n=1 Tax=Microbispora cellulosiformans TaxID=2614688 RepID=A0A5J5K416_9ACTN|nr:DUF1702 family protein [Microbispora cellulosiformans]KAA9377604.1 DUF1702 family protein [Microbispora cellulosiformans]
MTKAARALRRRMLTPNVSATRLDIRGFHEKNPAARDLLETIGRVFLTGFADAAEARYPADAEIRLEEIPDRFRGFAYEGAAMGFAVVDALSPLGGRRIARFLEGRGRDHDYMVYVGVGWAMARVPRFRWPHAEEMDPLLKWLALDGYGFHQAYFHTRRYVHEQYQDPRFPWPGGAGRAYAPHAIDQGIGRALWFVGGTDVDQVATLIERFPEHRRADLYSGTGLAATYAGGADEAELRSLAWRAGEYRPQVAQGSAFAAEARIRAGLIVPHTGVATAVFCDTTPEEAARVSRVARPGDDEARRDPAAYEMWRRRVADSFAESGRVSR